jgi:hypothetical protein
LPSFKAEDFKSKLPPEGTQSLDAIWDELGILNKGEDDLVELPNIPFTIVDNSGVPIIFHIPDYYNTSLTVSVILANWQCFI